MLDTETKRRIDNARDILVGKVPDPKSQVEQITIALIYKFMDDMDAESEELGGKRKFFTGDFARYGWAKLMSAGIGGHELIGLYGEGISTMPQNSGIPPLFRDIFKNAYLPYRDPETLKSFLKIIDEFSYDHSERLGDAFEYLLSVLGSQGDAGQFRTPRHIIDFMVEVLAPKKGEVILDPACGTAGFLISAYKHILRTNTDAKNTSTLTPDEKGRLAQDFHGYDISPDMVRLSLVNLYLHGFTDPHIFEYDTLTSDDRWNEFADVILANPPFMSPKGGIKPHKRFSIQAKRSEVLFVDYMAEHLTPTGRAGIIVPEGIIFQSQTAYKDLRKMLVENSLVAVVSLPAGVFQPYSGVKTSILILDKSLAKQCDTIAFFKVENDGFGLGAQRRANAGEQLTQVQLELAEYLNALRSHQPAESLQPTLGLIVQKETVAANGDYNLSGERYLEEASVGQHWKSVPLSAVCIKITDGSHNPPERAQTGKLMLSSQNIFDNRLDLSNYRYVSEKDFLRENQRTKVTSGDVLLTIVGTIGRCLVVADNMLPFMLQRSVAVLGPDPLLIQPEFLARVLQSPRLQNTLQGLAKGVAQKGVYLNELRTLQIPLPPLDLQKKIVAEIDRYQNVINGARAVLDNYRPHIPVHPDWPKVELGSVVNFSSGGTPPKSNEHYWIGDIPWIAAKDMKADTLYDSSMHVSEAAVAETSTKVAAIGSLLILVRGMGLANGVPICELARPCAFNQDVKAILPHSTVNSTFLRLILKQDDAQFNRILGTAAHGTLKIDTDDLSQITIPLPTLAVQQAIVTEIKAEQALVAANRELIALFEKKIETTIARIWGEDEKSVMENSAMGNTLQIADKLPLSFKTENAGGGEENITGMLVAT